jgi:hypothetical protein
MRIIAFITDAITTRQILEHIGEPTQPPITSPARGPPPCEVAMAPNQAGNDHQWDFARPEPDFEFDQRLGW